MRILLLSGEYPPQPGGVGDYTQQLAIALAGQGAAAGALTIQAGRLVHAEVGGSGEERRSDLGPAGRPWSALAWPGLLRAIRQIAPDWLHIQYQTGAFAMRPGLNLLPWRIRAGQSRPRLAVTFHDLLVPYILPKAGRLRPLANQLLAKGCELVVATNQADAAGLRRLAGAAAAVIPIGSNIAVAPPAGYERGAWRSGLGVGPATLLVAYFGLVSATKGLDLLIEALAELAEPDWRLLLIGGAATAPHDIAHAAALEARIASLGLGPRIIRTGHAAPPEVSAHLLAADCAALPYSDGASFRRGSLLAALAHGCPLVTTHPADPADARRLAAGRRPCRLSASP